MSFSMSNLIEKLNARDKDERYMAMHDLAADLDRDNIKLENEMERRVVNTILKHLEDSSTDVKQQAVRTIAALARKVQEAQLEDIADRLATHIINKADEEKRDIGSIGLKTLVGVLTQVTAPAVLKRVTPKLQQGIQLDAEVAHYCLEILNDLLKNFGMIMSRDLASIQSGILPMLSSPVASTRKRVSTCVASLAICAPEQLFAALVGTIFSNIETATNADEIRTYIQTIAGISRSVGHRLGRELKRIIPLFMTFCDNPKYAEDTEMLENCLQAFESFVLRCPKEILPHLDSIVSTSLRLIKHDPNYADEDEEDEMDQDEDEDEEDEYSDDGDYSGDDDTSWKVRSGAVKCLGAVIRTRPEMLNALYDNVLPQLMLRFREREEIVKMEVFSAFKDLMRQSQGRSADVADAMEEDSTDAVSASPIVKLLDVAKVMKAVQKQLKDKSFKTKERCLELLRELILVLDGGLASYLPSLITNLQKCVEKSAKTSLKVEALTLLALIIETHPGADLRQHVKLLGPSVLACVSDSNYKISAVALRVCARLCMAKFDSGRLLQQAGADSMVPDMYNATFGRLSSQDQDLEVKEAAIITMGKMVACLGDLLGPQRLSACLPVMLDRLKNETTRVTTLKVLSDIAKSELKADISSVCSDSVLECSTFLRKNDRALKQAALTTLTALVASYSSSIRPDLYEIVTKELSALVSSDELHLTHLSLQLCSCMVVHAPAQAIPQVHTHVLPKCIILLQSPLLQGVALSSLKQLYSTLVKLPGEAGGFKNLLDALVGIVYGGAALSRQSLSSIAQCVSSLCIANQVESKATVQRFIADLNSGSLEGGEPVKQLLLHCIGEIGRESDLSGFSLETVVMASFASASEDTKAAASLALGSLALGATEKYLPFILSQVQAQADYRYMLLQSLRQLITLKTTVGDASGRDSMGGHLSTMMDLLIGQCNAEDEGVRSMVAECLGRLALIAPSQVLPALKGLLSNPAAETRATVVYSLKFTITDQAPMKDLAGSISDFLLLLKDSEVMVRRAALTTLNSATHNKPGLIRPVLRTDWLLPALYGETVYKQELVRTVNLGPFQHKVDDGAELRKLSLACMDTLFVKCADKLDISTFLTHLQDRLSDELDDMKQAAYALLSKLAVREPFFVREVLDSLADPISAVLKKKTKENASPQDVERHNELQRSAMVLVMHLQKLNDNNTCLKFGSMYEAIQQEPKLKELLHSVQADSDGATASS